LDIRVVVAIFHTAGERLTVYGRTSDLSLSGAGLYLTRSVPVGSEVELSLRPPGDSRRLALRATVIRCQGSRVGVRFSYPDPEQRRFLLELCA
jgi:hypothetical protein